MSATATVELPKMKDRMAAAKSATPPPAPPPAYPKLEVGDIVHWYHGRTVSDDVVPATAVVTAYTPENGNAALTVVGHESGALRIVESSVPHRSDPSLPNRLRSDDDLGWWELKLNHLTAAEVRAIREVVMSLQPAASA